MAAELPPPPHSDAVVPVLTGTGAWLVALVVGLLADLDPPWTAVCATGLAFGLVGSAIVLRRRAAYRRAGRSASGQGG